MMFSTILVMSKKPVANPGCDFHQHPTGNGPTVVAPIVLGIVLMGVEGSARTSREKFAGGR